MAEKPIKLGTTMLSVYDVRYELYEVWNEIIRRQNHHVEGWTATPEGHRKPCPICEMFSNRIAGVRESIQHFGGKPRWDW